MIKDSLWYKYVNTRQGAEIIESELGFVQFKLAGEECFIMEMFVDQEARGKGTKNELLSDLEALAIENDCKIITGNIDAKDPFAARTLRAAFKWGFKILKAQNDIILIGKEIAR